MLLHKQIVPTILMLVSVSCTTSQISKRDMAHSEKLIGVHFSKKERATMQNYLNRNLAGYDFMHNRTLDNNVMPAVRFDPLPSGFQIPVSQEKIEWKQHSLSLPDNKEELAYYSVAQLASLIKSRQITSVELTTIYLNRIKKYDGELKAVITLTKDLALAQAARADREIAKGLYRGPLHGIPYGVKDLLAVKGYKTTWGAGPYKEQVIDQTATVVKKLEAAGAVLVAKLVSGSLARGDVWYGGKTKNPWDTSQGASGSSAGPGAATAAGLVAFSIGTETLGSIVSPSTRCGDTGLRPTYGRVSRFGVMSLSWSMDKVGPICRSAEDCALVFNVIRGKDPMDPTTYDASFNYKTHPAPSLLKVAYFKDLFDKDTTDNGNNNRRAMEVLKQHGVNLIPIEFPNTMTYSTYDIILRSEAGAFFDKLVRTKRDSMLVEQDAGSRANSLRQSRFIPAVEYLQANRYRQLLIQKFNDLISPYDAVLSPTFGGSQLLVTNLTGNPAMVVPTGFDKKGHPTSLTLIGNLFDEAHIIELAEFYQSITDYEEKHPPKFQ